MHTTLVRVGVALLGIAVFVLIASDIRERRNIAKAGKDHALASCAANGQTAQTCAALVKSRHEPCWKLAFRPSANTRYSRGPAAHLDQATYDDCVVRGPEVVGEEGAKAREELRRRQAAGRDAVLH